MPFASKLQQRLMFAKQARGELPKGTAERWASETDFENLPEKKKQKRFARGGEVMKCPNCGVHLAWEGGEVGDDEEEEEERGSSNFIAAIRRRKKHQFGDD